MKPEKTKEIIAAVYEKGDRMAICEALEPVVKGGYISLLCPRCGQRRAYTYQPGTGRTPHIIRCNRTESCGYSATLIEYAAGCEKPRGDDFKKAIAFLADKCGISIDGDDQVRLTREYIHPVGPDRPIHELVPLESYFQKKYDRLKMDPIGMDYLKSRGISEETAQKYGIKYAGWGQWPHYIQDNETGKKKPYRQWYPGRLVMPVFDTDNRLISLYGRAIPGDREPYKHLKHDFIGVTKGIFNQKALDEESVHITEGYFDALSFIEATKNSPKAKHVCAIFGVYGLSWDKVKAKNVCFCFDNDSAGSEWKRLAEDGLMRGKRIFFLAPETYQGCNDLSETWEKHRKIDFHYIELKKEGMP